MAHQPSITQAKLVTQITANASDLSPPLPTPADATGALFDVIDVQTTAEAAVLMSNASFQGRLRALPRVAAIKIRINEPLDAEHAEKPRRCDFQGKRRILISLESTKKKSQKILYWRCEDSGEFSALKLIHGLHSADVAAFARDFLVECLRKPDCAPRAISNSNELHLIELRDSRGWSVLIKAVNDENVAVLAQLLALPFDLCEKTKDGCIAVDVAWKRRNFDILLRLLRANSAYPADFDPEEASEEIRKFLTISFDMHAAVRANDEAKIMRILRSNAGLRYFYDATNTSAVTAAIVAVNTNVYRLLTEHNVLIGPMENIDVILESNGDLRLDLMKMDMRELHSAHAKSLPERHLMIHYANSVLGHDDQHLAQRHLLVKRAFNILNAIEETALILRVIAARREFKTHFDFNRSSVQFLDPYCGSPHMTGLFHSYGHLYIAMREILDDATQNESVATMSHEMDHFAMVLVFGNDGKPHASDDRASEERFAEIIKKCEALKSEEKIVRYVYDNYHPDSHAAELIVRVPQMITFYHDNATKLRELREIYSDLFEYYDSEVMPKMKAALPVLEKLSKANAPIRFGELNDTLKSQVVHAVVKFQGEKVRLSDILGDERQVFHALSAEEIREILYGENYFTLGVEQAVKTQFYAEREFIDYNIDTNKRIKNRDLSSKLFDKKISRNLFIENFVNDAEYNMEYNEAEQKYEWNEKVRKNLKDFDSIAREAEELKMILLSDHAGAGKTTTFKHLVAMLKEKNPSHWVSFIDLKRHLKVYEKFDKSGNAMAEDVFAILLEILSPANELEKSVFAALFRESRVILLFDGVDEISPKFKEFFIQLISRIRMSTGNQQWIATRPQHAEELIQHFRPNVYKLLPYNDDFHREHFIKKLLTSYDIVDEAQQEAALGKIFQSEALYTLNINNPLMLRMVTEIFIEDENLIKHSNMFSIYEGMIEMKKKILAKKGEIVNQDRENQRSNLSIWDVHMVYALKLICGEQFEDILADEYRDDGQKTFINLSDLSLMKRWKKQRSKWTPEMISRYGFLYIDHWNTENEFPDFAHRTFAEFFVAKWLIENIYLLDNEDDDEDEVGERELTLRLKFLINNMCQFSKFLYVFSFVMTYVAVQQRSGVRNFNDRVSKFLTGDMMRKFIATRCNIYLSDYYQITRRFLYFPWFFGNMQNLSSVWLIDGKQTFFQRCFNECTSFNRFRFLLYAFKGSFGASFLQFTGYPRNTTRRPNLISDEALQKAFDENFLINPDIDQSYSCRLRISLRVIEILNTIEILVIPDQEQRNFFLNCFKNILNVLPKYSFVADKLFETFRVLFGDHKTQLVDKLRVNLPDFYADCGSDKSLKFSLQIDNFWRRLEEFLSADTAQMRKILLSPNYERNHPLTHAALFDIESLVELYERHCTQEEIAQIFIRYGFERDFAFTSEAKVKFERTQMVEKHLSRCDQLEIFYLKKFLMSCNENGKSMLGLLMKKSERSEKHEKIINLCSEFLKKLLTHEQIEKLFNSELDMRSALDPQELFILEKLEEIYRKADWNDILQQLLLNDFDDMDDMPYFKNSREDLKRSLEGEKQNL